MTNPPKNHLECVRFPRLAHVVVGIKAWAARTARNATAQPVREAGTMGSINPSTDAKVAALPQTLPRQAQQPQYFDSIKLIQEALKKQQAQQQQAQI